MRLTLAALMFALAAQPVAAAETSVVSAADSRALQDELVAVAERSLQPRGYFIDGERVQLTVSRALPASAKFDVRPLWESDRAPQLPLAFELRPVGVADMSPIKATLAVALTREVLVVSERTRKGSAVSCADFHLERRRVREAASAVGATCSIAPESTALRELAAGDILRASDVGAPFAVLAGTPVRVDVESGAVTVSTLATALTDARVGDALDVRLRNPIRIFKTRVVAPGAAKLMTGEL